MKYTTTVLLIMMSATLFSQNQFSGTYTLNGFDEKLDCNLYFFKNGKYYIEIRELVTSDIVESLVLSMGEFGTNKDYIDLVDTINHHIIKLKVANRSLRVLQGFKFIIDKQFTLYNLTEYPEPAFLSSPLFVDRYNEGIFQSDTNIISLESGIYENVKGYLLIINANNTYSLKFKNIILSEGEWKKARNMLELKDMDLNHSYFLNITSGRLHSNSLPGAYKSITLIKNDVQSGSKLKSR